MAEEASAALAATPTPRHMLSRLAVGVATHDAYHQHMAAVERAGVAELKNFAHYSLSANDPVLGAAVAARLANESPEVRKAVELSGAEIAEHFFGRLHREFRIALLKQKSATLRILAMRQESVKYGTTLDNSDPTLGTISPNAKIRLGEMQAEIERLIAENAK